VSILNSLKKFVCIKQLEKIIQKHIGAVTFQTDLPLNVSA
jgi:hypothetical protein